MLIISLVYNILSSATSVRSDISLFYNRNLIIILLIGILIPVLNINFNIKDITLYNNLFNINSINTTFNIFILLLSILIIILKSFYPLKKKNILELYNITEYSMIILFIIIGAIFLLNSNDIISIFLSIELQSYGLYILCSLYRNSELSTSAGLTYFLLGSLSSCFILLGTSLFYTNSGVTSLDYFYIINNLYNITENINNITNYSNYYLLIMSVGFLFKISAAPFHFWSPDVYDAIPTITTTFVAIVTKISILFFLFELVNYTNNNSFDINWNISLLFSSLLSLIIGTILGLNQSRIKRLFAYSTISHLGFILLSLSINSMESTQAFIFYITQYSLTNLNAFILLLSFGYILIYYYNNNKLNNNRLQDKQNSPIQLINQIKGFYSINPLLSVSFIITIYSLIGIPPLMGFFGKQIVLSSSLDKGYIFISLVAILTSVISAVYYLNIVKCVFFNKTDYYQKKMIITLKEFIYSSYKDINKNLLSDKNNLQIYTTEKTQLNMNITILISILTLIILLFIFNPDEWLNMINILCITISN